MNSDSFRNTLIRRSCRAQTLPFKRSVTDPGATLPLHLVKNTCSAAPPGDLDRSIDAPSDEPLQIRAHGQFSGVTGETIFGSVPLRAIIASPICRNARRHASCISLDSRAPSASRNVSISASSIVW